MTPNSWETDKLQKKLFFQKLGKKPELLMVLTLEFDKNLQRYITFNLQRLSRTVLVYHFKIHYVNKHIYSKNFSPATDWTDNQKKLSVKAL